MLCLSAPASWLDERGLPRSWIHYRLLKMGLNRARAKTALELAHATGWAMGGEAGARERWHDAQARDAGWHDKLWSEPNG